MKKTKRGPVIGLLLLLFAFSALPGISWAEAAESGRVLVLLRSDSEKVDAARLRTASGEEPVARVAKAAGAEVGKIWPALSEARGKIFVLMTSDTKTTEELMAELETDPRVLGVCPDFKVRAFRDPDDPYYADGTLWGMARIRANEAWDVTTGDDTVYVAVADTGIYAQHEDLAANVDLTWSRNFANGDSREPASGGSYVDGDGHGTHVSGTIGAVGNNGKGVVGVNWNVRIIALKVLDDEGEGYFSWSVGALDYLVEILRSHPDMKIPSVNFSLGGWVGRTPAQIRTEPSWRFYWEAYKALDDLNRTVIVVAAGNEGFEVGAPAPIAISDLGIEKGSYVYPASLTGIDNMIVVGAVNQEGNAPLFSNWSSRFVQLVAPGTNITSTASPLGTYSGQKNLYYAIQQGTSMATPHVSGAVALLASKYPALAADQLKSVLLEGANAGVNPVSVSPYNFGKQTLSSNGLLDVKAALDILANGAVPTGITITPDADFSLAPGGTKQLSAVVTPAVAVDRSVAWSSENSDVATVDDTGLVRAVAPGSTAITARARGGEGVEDSVNVTVTESGTGEYTAISRSASVQSQLDSVNGKMASGGVHVDFGSLNNAMSGWTPSGGNQVVLSGVEEATLSKKDSPSSVLSGWSSQGKPAAVIDVDTSAGTATGRTILVPVTMQYILTRSELESLLGTAQAAAVLRDPESYAGVLFENLALMKEMGGGAFVNLIPRTVSPSGALSAGILTLSGGNSLTLAFSFLVADAPGSPSFDGSQLIVPDGLRDGRARDPLWLMKASSAPSPEPGPRSEGGGGGGGCNTGMGLAFIAVAAFGYRKRRRTTGKIT